MPQRSLQGRLHLHLAELADGEVEMLQRFGALAGVVRQQQLGELEAGEGDLGAEPDLGAEFQGLVIVGARLLRFAEEGGCSTKMAGWTG